MNEEVKPEKPICDLPDQELIEKCHEWISKLCKSGGRDWTLTIPPRVNHDPDIIFSELIHRYKSRIAELEAKSSPLEKSEKPDFAQIAEEWAKNACVHRKHLTEHYAKAFECGMHRMWKELEAKSTQLDLANMKTKEEIFEEVQTLHGLTLSKHCAETHCALQAMEQYANQFKKFSLIPEEPRSVATDGTEFKPEQEQRTAEEMADYIFDNCVRWYMKGYLNGRIIGIDKYKLVEYLASQFKPSVDKQFQEKVDNDELYAAIDLVSNKMFGKKYRELESDKDKLRAMELSFITLLELKEMYRSAADVDVKVSAQLRTREEGQFTVEDLDAAFVAGRSKTSWEQFKKDHGIS